MCSVASGTSNSLPPYGPQPARLLCPWDSPGKNTGGGRPALLQGIFPMQGWTQVSSTAGALFTTEPPGKSCFNAYTLANVLPYNIDFVRV